MTSFQEYLSQGNAWLFIPAAIVLGALHGFEPGHSKTMMAAFIIAVRGTVAQAVLLGVSATISHTAIIWIIAAIGLNFSGKINVEELEPWFQAATGVIVIGMAAWIWRRTRRDQLAAESKSGQAHHHGPHDGMLIDTGHGWLEISVFETNVPPRFRLYHFNKSMQPEAPQDEEHITLETIRPGGGRQKFHFTLNGDHLEATAELPEPHEFMAVVRVGHAGHSHDYEVQFSEEHHHHGHDHSGAGAAEYEDAHQREHAEQLHAHLANRPVTTAQIALFGLTGGLMPCPAALTVLLVCLQLKQFSLGFALVLAFSIGLALTLVSVGVVASLSVREATRRFAGFGRLAHKMPYASSGVMVLIGLFLAIHGAKVLLR